MTSSEACKVVAAELVEGLYCIKYKFTYYSTEWGLKLVPKLYTNSSTAKKFTAVI